MNIGKANRIFRWGAALVLLLGVILGTRVTVVAVALVVTFLLIFMVSNGIHLCIYEFKKGEKISTLLVATSYLAGCIVLLLALHALLSQIIHRFNRTFSQWFVFSLLMLLFVIFVGLLREGVVAISENLNKKRYALVALNLTVLMITGAAILIGGQKIADRLLR